MTRSAAVLLVSLSVLAFPALARASGPPGGCCASNGVALGPERFVALPVGRSTIVERVTTHGGVVLRFGLFHRALGVPMVAADGSGGGLSQDGRTLVLGEPRTTYPARSSNLYLVNPHSVTLERTIRLKGDLSFDAISPNGATIYLIKLSPHNVTSYSVRALDTASGRLLPKPIVDPREPDEKMRGFPTARVMSPDGRFAYTLYTGGDKPFIHALDTMRKTAACIDVPPLPDGAILSLRLNGPRLTVLASGVPASYVDPATRRVTKAPAAGSDTPATSHHGGSPPMWALLAAAAAATLGAALALAARRRRAGAISS